MSQDLSFGISGDRKPGFYWVLPIFDVDEEPNHWTQLEQPAYWDGKLWTMLGVENEQWQPIWVGEPVTPIVDRFLTEGLRT